MASTKTILARYQAILRRLKKSPASFDEISNFLDRESELQGLDLSIGIRTFKRDREDLFESFGIEIAYEPKCGRYRIVEEDNLNFGSRMFDAFNLATTLSLSDRISQFVMPETRRPVGSENFYGFVFAIENNRMLQFEYYKIEDDCSSIRNVIPLSLKESIGYWYLIARDEKDARVKTFATDRISALEVGGQVRESVRFDSIDYFKHSFGIIAPADATPQRIRLEFGWQQGQYIKRFPLHLSQRVISENDQVVVIELFMYITFDFEQKLLSYGPDLRVLEPDMLANTIREYHLRSVGR